MLAGAIGAFIAAFGNHIAGPDVSTANKVADVFKLAGAEIMIIVALAVVGALLCWVHNPVSKTEAFTRGLAILALISLAPASEKDASAGPPVVNVAQSSEVLVPKGYPLLASLEWMPHTDNGKDCPTSNESFRPNATIASNEWVSSSKPGTRLFSFDIFINECGNALPEGTEVQLIDSYETAIQGYYYVQVRYRDSSGQLFQGWVWSGRRPNYWQGVSPTQKGIDPDNVGGKL